MSDTKKSAKTAESSFRMYSEGYEAFIKDWQSSPEVQAKFASNPRAVLDKYSLKPEERKLLLEAVESVKRTSNRLNSNKKLEEKISKLIFIGRIM